MSLYAYDPPTSDALREARAHLAAVDPKLAVLEAATPAFEWRLRAPGFYGLAKMIVEQQVSVAAAATIWGRLEAGLGEVTPEAVLAKTEEDLRAYGLSRGKAKYVHGLAQAVADGALDFAALRTMPDDEAVKALVALKGVGLWTAETYLMFCEGRLDVFPGGDVALQEAMRWADRLEVRPTEKEAYARAELWRPHRGVAAHLLWRCYGLVKRGEIATRIGRSPHDRKKMAVLRSGGREAVTLYAVEKTFGPEAKPLAARVACRLRTGRTHQIRVHLASKGAPCLGDPVYGSGPAATAVRAAIEAAGLRRQALHARVLGFIHPISGETMRFETEPPQDMRRLEERLAALSGG